jgi:hypothetical protein
MNQSFPALAFQGADDSQMWIIIAVVLVILFFIVVIVVVGLIIFFIMRKRSKAAKAAAQADILSAGPSEAAYAGMSHPEAQAPYADPVPVYSEAASPYTEPVAPYSEPAPPYAEPTSYTTAPSPVYTESPAPAVQSSSESTAPIEVPDFDPSRTVAIHRQDTVAISYGSIRFVSGALAGQQFDVEPEGSYIGRESTLSQIVVSDPRISKRHLWIGVRDGAVKIVDQNSRNGTFLNDPKAARITEATLNSGDTVIMGESDVARFEYQA